MIIKWFTQLRKNIIAHWRQYQRDRAMKQAANRDRKAVNERFDRLSPENQERAIAIARAIKARRPSASDDNPTGKK